MRVSEVMTRGAECTRPDASVQEAARRMKELDVGSLPVCDNDRLVGFVTDRDITVRATAEACSPAGTCVRDVMTEASRLMEENQIRRLAVLNRDKRLVGMMSIGDLAVKTADDRQTGETLEQVSEPAMPRR
jgi:CBS domain-containing protein